MELQEEIVTSEPTASSMQWSAVFAGAAIATALSVVFLTFGTAIGLSFVSPWSGSRWSPKTIASIAVFWALAQQIGSVIAGGYIAGRMRSRLVGVPDHEVEFRDGLHGGAVWAVSVLVTTLVFSLAIGAIARGGADVAGRAAGGAAAAGSSSSTTDPVQYFADVLMRDGRAAPGGGPAPAVAQTVGDATWQQGEVIRILARSVAADTLAPGDRDYLATVVARRTGTPQADAEKRVDQVFAQTQQTVKDAAEKARRGAVLTGFVTAAGLILSLGAGWWAGQRGGHHRDNAVPASFVAIRRRVA